MTKELILIVKSSDKSGAVGSCVSHESMIAGEEAVWEREWTVCQVVDLSFEALLPPPTLLVWHSLRRFGRGSVPLS